MSVLDELYPLSHPQNRIWFSEKLHPGTGMWNNAGTVKITGEINFPLLERAVNLILEKCHSLRTRIKIVGDKPMQYINPYVWNPVELIDFTGQGQDAIYRWDREQSSMPTEYLECNLYYFAMLQFGQENDHAGLYIRIHHLISDAWSVVTLVNHITEAYDLMLRGVECDWSDKEDIPVYWEFLKSENEYMQSPRFISDRKFWNEKFQILPEQLDLKSRYDGHLKTSAERHSFITPDNKARKIVNHCRENQASIFSMIMAVFSIYLSRVTGKNDFVIGTSIFNRITEREKNTFGMFVSTVPIRITISPEMSFNEFHRAVADEIFSALRHQKYPFNLFMEELRTQNKDIDSLFDMTLSFQNASLVKNVSRFSYEVRWHSPFAQINGLDIHFNDREGKDVFLWDYNYLTSLFSRHSIRQMHGYIENLMTEALANPENKIADLRILAPSQEINLVKFLTGPDKKPPQALNLAKLYEYRAKNTPSSTALITGKSKLTAKELDERANGVAWRLKEAGVGHENVVIVMMRRSPELFAAMLGILKSGAAFLPLDPETPPDRVSLILSKSKAAAALAESRFKNIFEGETEYITTEEISALPAMHAPPEIERDPSSLAYVIYTSGTTGEPKGVMIENRTISCFAENLGGIMELSNGIITLCVASISFDLFIMESFPALIHGGTVVLATDDEAKIPESLAGLIKEHHINSIMFTPSRMQLLLSQCGGEALDGIKQIMLGGEALTEALVKKINAHSSAKIFNFYGPTETTIAVTYKHITANSDITIGRPMPNVNLYIMDPNGSLTIPGAVGELMIGGDFLARGYMGKKEETDAAFIPDPFRPGKLIYKTGDLVRLFESGEIIYAGRCDNQVKIRGYRIELGEIQSKLAEIEGITDCAVVDLENERKEKYLCAYICGESLPTRFELRAALMHSLPHYMVPTYFIKLPSLPTTINGKLNRKALPAPETIQDADLLNDEKTAPSTRTEMILAEIWEQAANIHPSSRYDNFFELGGDSLSIISVANQVSKYFKVDVSLKEVYAEPTLNAYAHLIDNAVQGSYTSIVKVPEMPDYPASSSQRRIFMLQEIDGTSSVYNMPGAFKIIGKFDITRLEKALKKIIELNAVFRTGFYIKNGELRQKIYNNSGFKIGRHKCKPEEVKNMLRGFIKPFDTSRPPLMRAEYIELGKNEHIVFIDIHHIISDGISHEMIFKQMSSLYSGVEITPHDLRYVDYSVWQKEYHASDIIRQQRDYWLENLSGELPSLSLRTDYPRQARQNFKGKRIDVKMPPKIYNGLYEYAKSKGTTTYTVMLSAFFILMARYSGQEDIIVGTPTSGRSREELISMIGMFVNTLALRAKPEADKNCADFISEVKKTVINGMVNQDYPFELLVNDLKIQRDLSHNPLFDVFFSYNTSEVNFELEGAKVSEVEVPWDFSKFDINFDIRDISDGMVWKIEYNELFANRTIKKMAEHYINILGSIIDDDNKKIGQIEILGDSEKELLIKRMRGPEMAIVPEMSVEEAIRKHASNNGGGTALIYGDKSCTFKELSDMSGKMANILSSKGVKANTVVVVSMPRSIELVAAIMGILRVGGAYLPIDPEYPEDRIAYMISDSGAKIAISDRIMPEGITVITPEQAFNKNIPVDSGCINPPESLAYLIYTSGSTGLPKGVKLTRENLANYCEACRLLEIFRPGEVSMSVTTISFDIFVLECIVSLYMGTAVAVSNEEQQRIPGQLAEFMKKSKCAFIQFTPSRLALMLNDPSFCDALGDIKTLVLGGEVLPDELLVKVKKYTRARIINFYGPTETTVYSTLKDQTKTNKVTIGQAVLNTQLYILDNSMNLVPEGVIGELYIGGIGVSPGYHERKDLTNERFIADPFAKSGKIYRTGDLSCLLPNGDIACLGRADDQIKLGGHRIEPSEIEKVLETYPEINKAVVVVRPVSGDLRLCCYFTSESKEDITADMLRYYLKTKLPLYMVPNYFTRMEKFPMTGSGKVDRKSLPAVDLSKQTEKKSDASMTTEEKKIAGIWEKVLKIENIGPDDDFFNLGGDSMAVIKAQIEMLKYGFSIGTQEFYENPTVRSMCALTHSSGTAKTAQKPADKALKKKYPAKPPQISQYPFLMKKVLLTGATGYLGAHVLKELADIKDIEILCLIRGSDINNSRERLEKILKFYFGESADDLMRKIKIICGDMGSGEGLSPELAPDTVINCAAETRHYGNKDVFTLANVTGVRKLIEFCKKCGAALCHISTTSVSGDTVISQSGEEQAVFTEKDFFINQNYTDNLYVKSKFEAEGLIFKEINSGLKAKVMRVGNLMPRYTDGVFQTDPGKNAFMNRLTAFKLIGAAPKNIIDSGAEFTPVDLCAKAIVLLTGKDDGIVYHLFNPYRASGSDIIEILNASGAKTKAKTKVKELSDSAFIKEVNKIAKSDKAYILGGMIADLVQIPKTGAGVIITCEETEERLSRLSFKWGKPDKIYLKKALAAIHDNK